MKNDNYEVILAIVNSGFADDVMAVAREQGARGGTVINARGVAREDAAKERIKNRINGFENDISDLTNLITQKEALALDDFFVHNKSISFSTGKYSNKTTFGYYNTPLHKLTILF